MVELGARIRRRPQLAKILGDQWGLKGLDPVKLEIDAAATTRLDAGLATELRGLPVAFDEDGLVVAVAEPTADRFDALRAQLGDVKFVVVPSATLDELLDERRATLKKTPTPVELVGAWLGGLGASSRVAREAEVGGRDTDEAPLDDDDLEEQRSETIEEVYAMEERHDNGKPPFGPVLPASPGSGSVVDHLRGLAGAIEALEHELVDTRRRAEAQEAELEKLRRARASDLETISNLRAELEERRRCLDGLRSVVGELATELDR
jgi:Type II secretion system (T2SS), protein E, N-terminal domain